MWCNFFSREQDFFSHKQRSLQRAVIGHFKFVSHFCVHDLWSRLVVVVRIASVIELFISKAIIPSDRLLVWNVKDGWEPLCKFLGKPVPDIPIPHDNVTGDSKFIEKYIFESDYGKEIMSYLKWNTALLLCKVGLYTAFAIHQYKTDGKFVKSVGTKIINNASKLALWT